MPTSVVGLEEPVRHGSIVFEVLEVEAGLDEVELVHDDVRRTDPMGQYVYVRAVATNTGTEEDFVDVADDLVDADGRLNTTIDVHLEGRPPLSQGIRPGESAEVEMIFDIDADATPAGLILYNLYDATGGASVDLADGDMPDVLPEPDKPTDDVHGVRGETVRADEFEWTVTGVETGIESVEFDDDGVGLGQDEIEADGQFILVHLTLTNVSTHGDWLDLDQVDVVDDAGDAHHARYNVLSSLSSDNLFAYVNPGNTFDTTVRFDIPKDAAPARVRFGTNDGGATDGDPDQGRVVIDLG